MKGTDEERDRAEITQVRRDLVERLEQLSQGAPASFKEEELGCRVELGVLEIFDRLAGELGDRATLEVIEHQWPGPHRSYRLSPRNPRAARVEAFPQGDEIVQLGIGVAGHEEWWVGRAGPDAFLRQLEEAVRSVIDGGVEEIYWVGRGRSEKDVRGSKLYVFRDGKRRRTGEIGVRRPLLGSTKIHRKYEPY